MTAIEPTAAWGPYEPAQGVRTLRLGGRNLLYAEDKQQVLELNDTADQIWRALAAAGSVYAAAQRLTELDLPPEQAVELVQDTALQWALAGYLAPQSLSVLLKDGGAADRTLALDELTVELQLHGVGGEEIDPVFGHLYGPGQGARRRLAIIAHADKLLFYVDGCLVHAGRRDGLVADVKAVLTDLYVDAVGNGFLTHGAWLTRGECGLVLSGEPGAGKTTLALALAAAGWRYGGDDIVRINAEGAAHGVPFAAAVKCGSVPLLRDLWPELGRLSAWARADGQLARYLLPPARAPAAPRDANVVVMLARRSGALAAAECISPYDALSAIVQSAYARRWRMTGDALCNLAERLDRAVCVRLEYSDLPAAVRAIGDIAGVEAQPA